MTNIFDRLNTITQSVLGEPITYKYKDNTEKQIKAIFSNTWVESNEVSTRRLTCEVLSKQLIDPPDVGDSIIRGDKTYKIEVAQDNDEIFTLVLKD